MKFLIPLIALSASLAQGAEKTKATQFTSLEGKWMGYFMAPVEARDYNFFGKDKVRERFNEKTTFTVNISSKGKVIEGTGTEEGYTNDPVRGQPVKKRSTLKGEWNGTKISFLKTYETFPEEVKYEGTINAELTEIKGAWVFKDPLKEGDSTAFELTRIQPVEKKKP